MASCSGLSYFPSPFQMLVTVLVSKRSSSRTMGEWSEREVMYVAYAGGQSWKPLWFKFSSRRAFLEDAESLDPAPCGPEPDHRCRQPRHVPLGQGGLVDQLDDHRALSPGGRAGGGILHGDDGAGGGDRHHPRHHHPPWGRGSGEGGGKYSGDAFANSYSIKNKLLSPLLIQKGGGGQEGFLIALHWPLSI